MSPKGPSLENRWLVSSLLGLSDPLHVGPTYTHKPFPGCIAVHVLCQMVFNAPTVFFGAAMYLRVYGVVNCIWLLMVLLVLF